MKQRTPQEKKRLSYEKDRRNRYGQSNKAPRRLIPLRKAKSRRAFRHAASGIMREAVQDPDGLPQDRAENRAALVDRKRWEKSPDLHLKHAIEAKKEWRVRRFRRKTGGNARSANLEHDPEGILRKRK